MIIEYLNHNHKGLIIDFNECTPMEIKILYESLQLRKRQLYPVFTEIVNHKLDTKQALQTMIEYETITEMILNIEIQHFTFL